MNGTCGLCNSGLKKYLFSASGSDLVECLNCGFVFVEKIPDWSRLKSRLDFWGKQDVSDTARLSDSFSSECSDDNRSKLGYIEKYAGGRGKLLEIGCSTGAFLGFARDSGWDCTGIEISEDSSRYAREELGLEVLNCDFNDAEFKKEGYSALAAFDVIEHVVDPLNFVKRANMLLGKGGVLALSTPNFSSITYRLLKERWWVVRCLDEHLHFFTPATMKRMLGNNGFRVARCYTRQVDLFNIMFTLKNRKAGDYYQARDRRQNLKKVSILRMCFSAVKKLINLSFRVWISPFYNMGEQIVCYAVKTGEPEKDVTGGKIP